jgi:hypothetical protein
MAVRARCVGWHRGTTSAAQQAREDIAGERLAIRAFGLPAKWAPAYRTLLEERLGVIVVRDGGCRVDDRLVETTRVYNDVMESEIARRFGERATRDLADEAKMTFESDPARPARSVHCRASANRPSSTVMT